MGSVFAATDHSCITLMLLRLMCQSAGSWFAPPSSLWGTCWRRRWWDHPSCSPFLKRRSRGEDGKWNLLLLKAQVPHDRPTSDVSHRNLLPLTRFPMVMWKKVLPLHQFAMRLNGWFASTSLKDKRIVIFFFFFFKRGGYWRKICQGQVSVFFTLVLGWMMVSPCLLMAIRTISGKLGSDVCWKERKL